MFIIVGLNKETGLLFAQAYSTNREQIENELARVAKDHGAVTDEDGWSFEDAGHRFQIWENAEAV